MSNEFYKYIAKQIIRYFTDNEKSIHEGERYSLTLDDEDMVKGVTNALIDETATQKIQGKYNYHNGVYETFTIILHDTEIVVASKMDGMKDDFLATLRNEQLTDNCFPILMILYNPIDTIISGTGDLSAAGMPFHVQTIVKDIEQRIKTSSLSDSDRVFLEYELKRKKQDRFSDKTSLFEYSPLLTILGKGKTDKDDFLLFSLLPDEELSSMHDKRKIEERLEDNHKLFQEVDEEFKYGDIKESLDKKFDSNLLKNLDQKKRNKADWYTDLTYDNLRESIQKRNKKDEHPLSIGDINIYNELPLENLFNENEQYFICDDGDTTAKKRRKNLLIYNSEGKDKLTIEIHYSMFGKAPKITSSPNIHTSVQSKTVFIQMNNLNGCTFAFVELYDETNKIRFTFKICVLNIKPDFLGSQLNTQYLLSVSQRLKNSQIIIQDTQDEITFNDNKDQSKLVVAEEGGIYECDFDQTLNVELPDDAFNNDTDCLNFSVKIGPIEIPFQIINHEKKKVELTEVECFKQKFNSKVNFHYIARTQSVSCGTTPYIVKGTFSQKLHDEWTIVSNNWIAARRDSEGNLKPIKLLIPDYILKCYSDLVSLMKEKHQVPSLIKYSDEYLKLGSQYVDAVKSVFESIKNGVTFSDEENDLLKIGCIFDDEAGTISMTPLHPLNVLYQIALAKEKDIESVRDDLIRRMSTKYLMPYIYGPDQRLYTVMDSQNTLEWQTYTAASNTKYRGSKQFVKKLFCEKVEEYKKHFEFLFDGIGNDTICINLINMGDCLEVLNGIILYFQKQLFKGGDCDYFVLNIYGSNRNDNQFSLLGNSQELKNFLKSNSTVKNANEISDILEDHVKCFFKEDENGYDYAHLTFVEMTDVENKGFSESINITTGISLNGIMSGVPSVLDGDYYKTGFGLKYAPQNDLISLAELYNSMFCVAYQVSSYQTGKSVVTTVPKRNDQKLKKIYDASNWVVFVDPKVDLSYFNNSDHSKELMIIHYSDQLSSSSSYDDITVTNKSDQYKEIIKEQLQSKGVSATDENIRGIIDLFNAVNGSWLLHLITAKKLSGAADSNFSREKMSILSAIKLSMAFYQHPDITWVPLSLEEILRVSHGTGLSPKDGILSAQNLGFEKNHPTCDDILLIGVEGASGQLKLYVHPVEVKIGINSDTYIGKAIEQATNTHDELIKCMWPEKNHDDLSSKLVRNFIAQLVITSAEKMKMYHVNPSENWDLILDSYREKLLNDEFVISNDLDSMIGIGTVISFRTDNLLKRYQKDDAHNIEIIDFPEKTGSEYMIQSVKSISDELQAEDSIKDKLLKYRYVVNIPNMKSTSDEASSNGTISEKEVENSENEKAALSEKNIGNSNVILTDEVENHANPAIDNEKEPVLEKEEPVKVDEHEPSMKIQFGTDITTGAPVYWYPNNTHQLFHTNTGIIGTMGTGKTQFTKSLVAQLMRERNNNLGNPDLGILIFDYKGDYNESKEDFVSATNAKIFKPYHLPFNPFALVEGKVFRPLLPVHIANGFKDTLSKIYGLGPKQEKTLTDCIISAYASCGISTRNRDTWKNQAPTFDTVNRIYEEDEDIKKTDSLAAAMSELDQYEVFEPDPAKTESLYDLVKGVVVIDLSGYPESIQSLIIAITLDLFYLQMQAHGSSKMQNGYRELTKFILVDEADNFMSQNFPSLKKIMKEGREFGVGTILSTQFLKHFGSGEDDYSKYILTWVVHNVADLSSSDVDFVFKVDPKGQEEQRLYNDIKKLQIHHSIVKIGTENPQYIEDLPFWKLIKKESN